MTEMLEKAIFEVRQLPEADQDAMAHFILEELEDEKLWGRRFCPSEVTFVARETAR